eukprot:1597145-Amphidinium_carterae.1
MPHCILRYTRPPPRTTRPHAVEDSHLPKCALRSATFYQSSPQPSLSLSNPQSQQSHRILDVREKVLEVSGAGQVAGNTLEQVHFRPLW